MPFLVEKTTGDFRLPELGEQEQVSLFLGGGAVKE
jgi:hypothetical protein